MKNQVKRLALVLAVALGCAAAQAWEWTSYCDALEGDRWLVKAGVGYGFAKGNWKFDQYGVNYTLKGTVKGFVIPIQGEFLLQKIPLGITLGVRPLFGKYSGVKTTAFTAMAGANYHVAPGPKALDLYAGMEMGLHYATIKWPTFDSQGKPSEDKLKGAAFAFGAHVGANFLFTEHFGVNAEVGYPNILSASAAFKF